MKNFKLRVFCILAVLTLSGQETRADKQEKLINQMVCANGIKTQCLEHCSNYCNKLNGNEERQKCVSKNCVGVSGYCNIALMGQNEDFPGTLKARIKKSEIPKEFYVHLKDYKKCLASGNPGASIKEKGEQWSEGLEDALGR